MNTFAEIATNSGIPGFKFENAKLGQVLSELFNIFFYLATFIAFFWLVWAAFQYITASGDKQKLAQARARITWAIVGLLIIAVSLFVAQFTAQILNLKEGIPIL